MLPYVPLLVGLFIHNIIFFLQQVQFDTQGLRTQFYLDVLELQATGLESIREFCKLFLFVTDTFRCWSIFKGAAQALKAISLWMRSGLEWKKWYCGMRLRFQSLATRRASSFFDIFELLTVSFFCSNQTFLCQNDLAYCHIWAVANYCWAHFSNLWRVVVRVIKTIGQSYLTALKLSEF